MCHVSYIRTLTGIRSPPGLRFAKRIGDTNPCYHNLMDKEIDVHFLFQSRGISL